MKLLLELVILLVDRVPFEAEHALTAGDQHDRHSKRAQAEHHPILRELAAWMLLRGGQR